LKAFTTSKHVPKKIRDSTLELFGTFDLVISLSEKLISALQNVLSKWYENKHE